MKGREKYIQHDWQNNKMFRVVKPIEDYLVASVILCVMSPVMLLIAVVIKLSFPSPVFLRRMLSTGVWRFRTGYLPRELRKNPLRKPPRPITMFCGALRRTDMDKLPEFLNVLQGGMSVIGPRPHTFMQYKRLMPDALPYRRIKPGITGWPQVNGFQDAVTSEEDLQRRLELDLYYFDHWSVWFDLKILVLSLKAIAVKVL